MEWLLKRDGWTATVCDHGGELIALRDAAGTEYLWNGDPAWWPGRNPVLFPIVGGLENGQVCFDGRPYAMNRHGFARDLDFTLADLGADYAVLTLREQAETLARYPYPFCLTVTHRLIGDGFSTTFSVENPGEKPLPFCIGAHTAFRCPLRAGEWFEDYCLQFAQPETVPARLLTPAGLLSQTGTEDLLHGGATWPLDYDTFARLDTLIFEGTRSWSVAMRHRDTGHGVRLHFDGFPMVAFWTKPGAPFLCLEPWHGCAAVEGASGEFAEKPHCVTLKPGETWTLGYRVEIL
jgi:galactose mutarotase-like enzyme